MTSRLTGLKSLDDASVDRTDGVHDNASDITWQRICQSQIQAAQSLRAAYLDDIKSVYYLTWSYLCSTFMDSVSIVRRFDGQG